MDIMWNSLLRRDGDPPPQLQGDTVDTAVLAGATGIAWAFALELNITIFLTFKRRNGLYFWSLLACSWGLSIHALAFILKFLVGSSWLLYLPFVEVGWVLMVTGQAFVLYSRLHLVVRRERTLRRVLWLIIIDAIILHIPTIVLTYGSNSPGHSPVWQHAFDIMERIQLTGFCCQEFIISGIYLWSVIRIFNSILHTNHRRVMIQLVIINALCIAMDIILIGLEFSNDYIGEASLKPMIYAIKLKLEFVVLNQLVSLTIGGHNSRRGSSFPRHSTYVAAADAQGSFSNGVALETQRPAGNTGPVVSISAQSQGDNDSSWAKKLKRGNKSDRDSTVIAGLPDAQTMRQQTTTTVTSEAVNAEETASNSSAEYKFLQYPQPVPHRTSWFEDIKE